MKKSYIFLIVVIFIVSIWFLINSDDINKVREIRKISQQKEHGLFLSDKQQIKLENYIKEIAEIKVRGCSLGANIIFVKCAFTDSVGKYALGDNTYQHILNEVWTETHKSPEVKSSYESEKEIREVNKIYQDYKEELDSIYEQRKHK